MNNKECSLVALTSGLVQAVEFRGHFWMPSLVRGSEGDELLAVTGMGVMLTKTKLSTGDCQTLRGVPYCL